MSGPGRGIAAFAALAVGLSGVACSGAKRDRAASWKSSGIDWSKPPAPGPEPSFEPPAFERFALGNGIEVIFLARHRLPLVSLTLLERHGGGRYDPPGRAGLAGLTADLLDEGAGPHDALALVAELERLGASLDIGAGADTVTISLDTLSSTFADSLELMAAIVGDPHLLRDDFSPHFERVRGDRISEARRRRDNPRDVAALILDRLLFGENHPYGWPLLGMEPTLAAITLDDVRRFYRTHYHPRGLVVVVCGDIERDELGAALEATLGRLAPLGPPPRESEMPPAPPPKPLLAVVDRKGAPQSVVYMGRIGPSRTDPEYHVASVLNTVFGGTFASRLNHRLREQLGYTYGADSSFWMGRSSGTWAVRTEIETPHTAAGIAAIFRLMDDIRANPVPRGELEKAENFRVRSLPEAFATAGGTARAFAHLAAHGLPLDWYGRYAAEIRGVTAAEIRDFAVDSWDPGAMAVVVVGDLDRIHADLLEVVPTSAGGSMEYGPDGSFRGHRAAARR